MKVGKRKEDMEGKNEGKMMCDDNKRRNKEEQVKRRL